MKLKLKLGVIAAALLLCGFAAWAAFQAARPSAPTVSMAAMLPQGALLTIESPDFAALLRDWNSSPEQKAWLASDNYSVYSKSRIFGRLNDARTEFEAAAKTSPSASPNFNGDFLTQVAGRQSIFAWYDVGNLEFLYITRISSAQASNIALLRDRASWSARQSGGATFYIRQSTSAGPVAVADEQAQSAQGKARTVAFAEVSDGGGELLILATREDLIANALQLIHPAPNGPASVAQEAWFTEASAALPGVDHPPVLHMVMNLERLVPRAYFRSYWIQQNVSEMKQYRAAVSDLYPYPAGGGFGAQFREYRALLLRSPDSVVDEAYLGSLTGIVPNTGVYRAAATHDPNAAVTALEEKLLGRITLEQPPDTEAPDPSLEVTQSGSTSDLETRIDTPAVVTPGVSNRALAETLNSAGLDAVLTYSTATAPATQAGLWVPIHSAVVLEAAKPWNAQTLQTALQQSLRGDLTTSTLGIEFRSDVAEGQTVYMLTGPKPLFFATLSTESPSTSPTPVNLCLLSDDRALLLALLGRANELRSLESRMRPAPATLVAGFDHSSQRAPFARVTSLIDGTNRTRKADEDHVHPAFFSGNIHSLSDSFAALGSEYFDEHRDGAVVRQSLIYQWQAK